MTHRCLFIVGALSIGLAAAAASAADPSPQELIDQVKALQAKVEKLEAQQQQQTQAVHAKDVDETVASIMSDADKRSKFLAVQNSGFAGYDEEQGQFRFESADRRFSIHPYLMMQPRGVINSYNPAGGDRDADAGFEISRGRLGIDGNAFLEGLFYRFQWESGPTGGFALQDAYVLFHMTDDYWLRVGQFKNELSHEYRVDESRQLAVDRSFLDAELGGTSVGRTQGVGLIYDNGGTWRWEASVNDGALTANTTFADGAGGLDSDFGFGARVEYLAYGNWHDYDDLSARDTVEDLLVLGGGAFWSQSGDTDLRTLLFDAQWETVDGLVVSGEAIVSPSKFNGNGVTSYGASVQAGYMLTRKWEVFGRLGITKFDDAIAPALAAGTSGEDTFPEIAGGLNYYFGPDGSFGHRFKLTMDVTALPNGTPAIGPLDFLASDEFEIVFRSQLTFKI